MQMPHVINAHALLIVTSLKSEVIAFVYSVYISLIVI